MYLNLKTLTTLALVALLASCANIVSPQGGDKDVNPPFAIASQPRDSSTNFNSTRIEIKFNEFIQLKDPQQNISISPPLAAPLFSEVNGKTLTLKLKDLKPNTTYTIKALNSIADITEGNLLQKLVYVFSTGTSIDTLRISGTVRIAATMEKAKLSTVVLNKDLTIDTPGQNSLPDYYSISDEQGGFTIDNVRQGTYYISSFEDKNKNLRPDDGEPIGFIQEPIMITDSTPLIRLLQFEQEKQTKDHLLSQTSPETGIYILEFQKETRPSSINQVDFNNGKTSTFFYKRDSSNCKPKNQYTLYTDLNPKDSAHFNFTIAGLNYEMAIRTSSKKEGISIVNAPIKILEDQEYSIQFNRKLDTLSTDLKALALFSDTVRTNAFFYFRSAYSIGLKADKAGAYSLRIPKKALNDIYGITNDSLNLNYVVIARDQTGSLALRQSIRGISNPVLRLSRPDILYCANFSIRDTGLVQIPALIPGKYSITLFNDLNMNGIWDSGDYYQRQLPEEVFYFKESEVSTDFETEEQIMNSGVKALQPDTIPEK